jgi:hypothetical protein
MKSSKQHAKTLIEEFFSKAMHAHLSGQFAVAG